MKMYDTFIYNPPEGRPNIIFEDNDFLAVDKPSGLLTVPGRKVCHKDSLFNRLSQDVPDILPVHRLDMDTSGIVLFAKNKMAQSCLSKQFSERLVKKLYFARVLGRVGRQAGTITYSITRDWPRRPLQKVCEISGKFSKTNWRLVDITKDPTGRIFSNLLVQPITGRTHQIRIHLKEMGFPIIGDKLYGNNLCRTIDKELNLQAYSLKFYHSGRRSHIRLTSPRK